MEDKKELPDYDILYEAFKEGNNCAVMPEDDWKTVDIDFRKWYDTIKKRYKDEK